jgi:tetratricopeptide (TPR) repeat protein
LYDDIGLYEKALPLYEEALQIRARTVGKQNLSYVTSLNNLGVLYMRMQEYDKAIAFFEESLQTTVQTVGKQHEKYARYLGNLASVYDSLQQYEKSLPLLEEVLQIWEQIVGKKHPDYATALNNIATWYFNQQLYEKALPLYEEVLQIWAKTLGEQHPNYALAMYSIGRCFIELQEIEKGIQYIQEAYQILLAGVGKEHPYTQQVGIIIINILNNLENNTKNITIINATTENVEYNININKEENKIYDINNDLLQNIKVINNKEEEIENKDIIRILLFWAIPAGTNDLKIYKEFNNIKVSIQDSQDVIRVKEYSKINKNEFVKHIMIYQPYILHFSGHGTNKGKSGILLQNDNNNNYDVFETYQIKGFFEELKKYVNIKVIIINACYSKEQVKVIKKYVPYVIGIDDKIEDDYAVAFSEGFYFQLQRDVDDIEKAFDCGRMIAVAKGAGKKQFVIYKLGKLLKIK